MIWTADYNPDLRIANGHLVVVINGSDLLAGPGRLLHPYDAIEALSAYTDYALHLGSWQDQPCFVLRVQDDAPVLPRLEWVRLRSQLGSVPDQEFALGGRAQQLIYWFERHRFCGRCGGKTTLHPTDRAMQCTHCDLLFYPQIAPCVLALVLREGRCLLAHNARFPQGLYSILAGFIEPGETAERAVIREVKEEVGLEIDRLRYIDSQSWPFPSQLMLGFVASCERGEICVDGQEIIHADWFSPVDLPPVPPPQSLSGRLIEQFVQGLLRVD